MPTLIAILNILMFFLGQYYVTRKNQSGFLVWGASNLMVAAVSILNGNLGLACIFVVYGMANTYSLVVWFRQKSPYKNRENEFADTRL